MMVIAEFFWKRTDSLTELFEIRAYVLDSNLECCLKIDAYLRLYQTNIRKARKYVVF